MSVVARWTAKRVYRLGLEAKAKREHTAAQRKLNEARERDLHPRGELVKARDDASDKLKLRREQVAAADRVLARNKPLPLRERAYVIAAGQVGVMESGGNNSGVPFSRFAQTNGASGPEAWCGDFVAYCYRLAGSKRVVRSWASVGLIRGLLGIKATTSPLRGDLVRFTFDHVGIFAAWCDANGRVTTKAKATHILTVEGNTGATGAVSDSVAGGDGVYRKVRSTSLVRDYLKVLG